MQHSKIGASSCNRWWNCAGSVNLIELGKRQGLIVDSTSIYAVEGTAAHEVAASCLTSGVDAGEWIGEEIEVDGYDKLVPFTRHMADAVQIYLDTIRSDMETMTSSNCFLEVEQQFNLSFDEGAFGTNDALLIFPYDTLVVYDYKHGWGLVEVKDNLQLLYYAIGAIEKYPDIKKVMIVIVQPRADHEDGAVRRATYTYDELMVHKQDLIRHINATREPTATLLTGAWCSKNYCDAINVCPAVQKEVQENAIVDFSNSPMPHPSTVQLSIEQLQSVKNKAELIKKFVASCVIALQKHAEAGVEIPAHKLVRSRGHRSWKNKAMAEKKLHMMYGEEAFDKKLRSPAEMELVMKKDGQMDLFKTLVKKPDGSPTLVSISDSRNAIEPSIFTDFL